MTYQSSTCEGLDKYELDREIEIVKSRVFMGKLSAFLGSIMCSLEFIWSDDCPTAATDGLKLWWNPQWFLKSSPKLRRAVLLHELWHVARMHMIRIGDRNMGDWNVACDIVINNSLIAEGEVFEGFSPWIDPTLNGKTEEEIYDLLQSGKLKPPPSPWGGGNDGSAGTGDMVPLTKEEQATVLNKVITASHQHKLSQEGAGKLPGGIEGMIQEFLKPVIKWQDVLSKFFTEMLEEDYTWKRPNRRYSDMYLPSRFTDDGRLEHLLYFCDVSGSVSDHDMLRFNSELKYIQENFRPQRLTIAQFDTRITQVIEFTADEDFDAIKIIGRGGTFLGPVKAMIDELKPTAAVIFSDLRCHPMDPLEEEIPVVWVVVKNPGAAVPFGSIIHLKD